MCQWIRDGNHLLPLDHGGLRCLAAVPVKLSSLHRQSNTWTNTLDTLRPWKVAGRPLQVCGRDYGGVLIALPKYIIYILSDEAFGIPRFKV